MSTLTMPSGMPGRSNLNPNAPLFVPMAFQQVEEYSPEWWDLVKTTAWYREYWFHQHQEQEPFRREENDDVVNLLPDSFDFGIDDQLAFNEAQSQVSAHYQTAAAKEATFSIGSQGEKFNNHGFGGGDVETLFRSLNSNSPMNVARVSFEEANIYERPMQSITPKYGSQYIIQQSR